MRKFLHTVNLMIVLLVAGCGGYQAYEEETFNEESPFKKELNVSAQTACNAAQLTLLNQGYTLKKLSADTFTGQKDFQPEEEKNIRITFNVACKNHEKGSTIFATAVQTTYKLNTSHQSASLGVPLGASISLPVGNAKESLDMTSAKTISDEDFYSRFYDLMQHYLEQLKQPSN